MKIGVSSYSFSQYCKETGSDLFEVCRLAKEIGFDAIEFAETPEGDNPLETAMRLRDYCESIRLPISSFVTGADFLNGNPEQTVKNLKEKIDIAEAFGAKIFRHDICFSLPNGVTWQDAIVQMIPYIREVTEYAKAKGIQTCSENHGYLFQDSERVEALIRAVDNPNYRWLVDVGNFLCVDEDPAAAVRRAAPYAIHAHVKDFLYRKTDVQKVIPEGFSFTRGGNLLRGTVIGHGDVPVDACINSLLLGGYRGMFVVEFEGLEKNLDALRLSLKYLRRLFSEKEGK